MEDDKEMYIPTIGAEITLAKVWRFGLYYEYRNEALIKFIFPEVEFKWRGMVLPNGIKPEYGQKICDVELPKGAILKVDRIYIRKGGRDMKEFDSVTFNLQSLPKSEISVPTVRSHYVRDGEDHFKVEKKTIIKKRVRFWAKLRDVNQIRFLMGREKIEGEEVSAMMGRFIRLGEGWLEGEKC